VIGVKSSKRKGVSLVLNEGEGNLERITLLSIGVQATTRDSEPPEELGLGIHKFESFIETSVGVEGERIGERP